MNSLTVSPLLPSEFEEWNAFVENSDNGTLFHRTDFLAYHGNVEGRNDIVVRQGSRIVGIMTYRTENTDTGSVAVSPWGASFGGLVTTSTRAKDLEPVCATLHEHFQRQGIDRLVVSQPPACYSRTQGVAQEYFLLHSFPAFRVFPPRVTSVVNLTAPRPLSTNMKRNAAHARKSGVRVTPDGSHEAFYDLLLATLQEKHGSRPTHSREEFLYLAQSLPGNVRVFLAELEKAPQAGVLVLENASPCVFAFYNAHDHSNGVRGSLALLFRKIFEYYSDRGKLYCDLGASSRADAPLRHGLLRFKEGLGSTLFYRNTFELRINPDRTEPSA